VSRALSRAWEVVATKTVARPLSFPARTRVITIGGPTLGGSGKTPLAIACARALGDRGVSVAFVGHAYRARPGRARLVTPTDDVDEVGDEALVAAGELRPLGVPVVVAPSRQAAFDLAQRHADVVVIDGPLQLRPRRADLALLAVDPFEPWGAGESPPCGDLRASRAALVSACDRIVSVERVPAALGPVARPVDVAVSADLAVDVQGRLLLPGEVRTLRLGLVTHIARPHRLVASLARSGLSPLVCVSCPDHSRARPREALAARRGEVDLWLCTQKCARHLPGEFAGKPLAILQQRVDLPHALERALLGLA
jgi:tetraacyldisaccharide 4'-kinase